MSASYNRNYTGVSKSTVYLKDFIFSSHVISIHFELDWSELDKKKK